jgi:hypothetical protein
MVWATVAVASALAAVPMRGRAQVSDPPTIHRVTLRADTGVLTIAGTGLGPDLHVTVDGQPAATFPGATGTQMEVQAPASLTTVPGTYRLTVIDPVRRVWDGFVVASPGISAPGIVGVEPPRSFDAGGTPRELAPGSAAGESSHPTDRSAVLPPLAIIEDTGSPYRTAIGSQALDSNTTGIANTAAGYTALTANTTGSHNTATGYQALQSNATGGNNTATGTFAMHNATGSHNTALGYNAGGNLGSGNYNIYIGSQVSGATADANTLRIGVPFSGAPLFGGQNRAFIAGIVGVNVGNSEAVYIDSSGQLGSGPVVPGTNTVSSTKVVDNSLTAADLAMNAVGTSELGDDAVTAAKVAFPYAGSTSEGGPATDVACTACVGASEVAFTFAGLGPNTFAGTQRITGGHLDLTLSSANSGGLTQNGSRLLHTTGVQNTFLGGDAGNYGASGSANTGVGHLALAADAVGTYNTAVGAEALRAVDAGHSNTATGSQALMNLSAGANNTAVGHGAGRRLVVGTHNVYLGAHVEGLNGEAHTMRLGLPYDATTASGQFRTFVAGIHGTVLTAPAVPVFVDANGQLGTLTPPPIVGSVDGGVTPGAAPSNDAAPLRELAEQRALIAALQARLAAVEAELAGRRRR